MGNETPAASTPPTPPELPSMIGDTLTAGGDFRPTNTAGGQGIEHR